MKGKFTNHDTTLSTQKEKLWEWVLFGVGFRSTEQGFNSLEVDSLTTLANLVRSNLAPMDLFMFFS